MSCVMLNRYHLTICAFQQVAFMLYQPDCVPPRQFLLIPVGYTRLVYLLPRESLLFCVKTLVGIMLLINCSAPNFLAAFPIKTSVYHTGVQAKSESQVRE